MYLINKPALVISPSDLKRAGISPEDFRLWIPRYLTEPKPLTCGVFKNLLLKVGQWPIQMFIKLCLRPPADTRGEMDIEEVRGLYDSVAPWYNWKHHFTTHWYDDVWRNFLAQSIVTFARVKRSIPMILDLCCGTGLSVEKMAIAISNWGFEAEITGLDYSSGMLAEAEARHLDFSKIKIKFVRGNAMDLSGKEKTGAVGLTCFSPDSFNAVTTMFGLGGINNPDAVASGVLAILKEGGQWFFTDMHEPLAHQPGRWPFLFWTLEIPSLEAVTYRDTTIPLALHRLWRWRDTTLDFYRLPLATWQDSQGQWWGFKVVNLEIWSQPWWFLNLPVMPVGKILLEKVRISNEEVRKRDAILSLVTSD